MFRMHPGRQHQMIYKDTSLIISQVKTSGTTPARPKRACQFQYSSFHHRRFSISQMKHATQATIIDARSSDLPVCVSVPCFILSPPGYLGGAYTWDRYPPSRPSDAWSPYQRKPTGMPVALRKRGESRKQERKRRGRAKRLKQKRGRKHKQWK